MQNGCAMSTQEHIKKTEESFKRIELSLQSGWVARDSGGQRVSWIKGAWHHTKNRGAKPVEISRHEAASLYVNLAR
jgi:hypothetical protein